MKGRAILILGAAFASAAQADITSTFDTDNEGWLSANVSFPGLSILETHSPTWNAGHIEDSEGVFSQSGLFVLAAPAPYLGNLSSYYGGKASYRLSDALADGIGYPNLLLRGNGIALGYVTPPPTSGGTDFSIPLTETGWITLAGVPATKAQFLSALSNLDVFAINADWKSNGTDRVTLDNVVVTAVPEPTTMAVLGLGMVGVLQRRSAQRPRSK